MKSDFDGSDLSHDPKEIPKMIDILNRSSLLLVQDIKGGKCV